MTMIEASSVVASKCQSTSSTSSSTSSWPSPLVLWSACGVGECHRIATEKIIVNEISIKDGNTTCVPTLAPLSDSSSEEEEEEKNEQHGENGFYDFDGNDHRSLSPSPPSSKSLLGERIQQGQIILTINNLITSEEIQYMKQVSIETAELKRSLFENTNDNEDVKGRYVVRMPTFLAGVQNKCIKYSFNEEISTRIEEICIERILQFVDHHLCPSVKRTLFGYDKNTTTTNCDEKDDISIAKLFRTSRTATIKKMKHEQQNRRRNRQRGCDQNHSDLSSSSPQLEDDEIEESLTFSRREPAINVYTAPNGHFGMHRDDKDMTILIPLSDPINETENDSHEDKNSHNDSPDGDFVGGGTAFWYDENAYQGRDDPSYIIKPQAGTVVIFGGQVQHSGLHITNGTRVVFVASFSRNR